MNLIWFLTIGTLIVSLTGEFGKFPFGNVGNSVNLLDLFTAFTAAFFLIWKIGIAKKTNFPKIYLFLVGFASVGLLSLLINLNFDGVFYLIRFVLYSLFFWISYSLTKENFSESRKISSAILLISLIAAFLGAGQLMLYPNLSFLTEYGYDPHINRLAGSFLDPNFLGAYLTFGYAVALILFLKTKQRIYLFSLLVLLIAVILTFSRSAWVMLGVLNLFTVWLLPKKIISSLLIFLVLLVIFIPRVGQRLKGAMTIDTSASERLGSWDKGIEIFKLNPVIGIGFNNIKSVSIENGLIKPFTADGGNSGSGVDSSWILILATSGIIGGAIFSIFYFKLIWRFFKAFYKTRNSEFLVILGLLIAFFIQSQFINSLFYPPIMVVWFLLMGNYYAKIKT